MKRNSKKFFFAVIIIFITVMHISGCAKRVTKLENQQGEQVNCYVTTTLAMLGGMTTREVVINRCIEKYEAEGYKLLEKK